MKKSFNHYRVAGIIGGLLLAAGQFYSPLCLLQLLALLPLMLLALRDRKLTFAAAAGFYMGIAYTIPQMIYLRMPLPVTVILMIYITALLIILAVAIAWLLPKHPVLGPLAVAAAWYILDWLNYTAIPIWGMAQSFARSWTAYPFLIGFISVTSISGVLFVIALLQGFAAHLIFQKLTRPAAVNPSIRPIILTAIVVLIPIIIIDIVFSLEKPTASLKIAAACWVFDESSSDINPHNDDDFEKLFTEPAEQAASKGARIFTTGEMGFYFGKYDWQQWMDRFAEIARQNDLWLVVGYFNTTADENRIFFMSPQGEIIHEYTKTYLTPLEPGKKGTGALKTIEVDGLTVGAMICQDDNFSNLTRRYGKYKIDLLLCPTADWWNIKNAHLQAVRARAIECNYPIARGAACGISAAISAKGRILAKLDHYRNGPGSIIADVNIYKRKTLFSRLGHTPSLAVTAVIFLLALLKLRN